MCSEIGRAVSMNEMFGGETCFVHVLITFCSYFSPVFHSFLKGARPMANRKEKYMFSRYYKGDKEVGGIQVSFFFAFVNGRQ